jgi:tetratricopeptide (TPR) repeat protein
VAGVTPKTSSAAVGPSLEVLEQQARAPGAGGEHWLRWGWALYAAGRYAQSAEAAREAIARTGADPEPGYLLGMALKAGGDKQAAVTAFRAAAAELPALQDVVRAAMLRRLAVGQINWLERGEWDLEPETWVRT